MKWRQGRCSGEWRQGRYHACGTGEVEEGVGLEHEGEAAVKLARRRGVGGGGGGEGVGVGAVRRGDALPYLGGATPYRGDVT